MRLRLSKSKIDVRDECFIIYKMMVGWKESDKPVRIHLPQVRQAIDDGRRSSMIVRLDEAVGSPRKGLQWYAFILGIAVSPFLLGRQRRVIVFALVFLLITWSMMAFTKNAGNGVHHTILLWPMRAR